MTCNQCGQDVLAGSAFCPHCGAALAATGAQKLKSAGAQAAAPNAPEQELWAGAYSSKAMIGPFIAAGLLAIGGTIAASFIGSYGLIVTGLGVLLLAWLGLLLLYRRTTVTYRLTSQRLLRASGILNRTDDRILVIEIDDVTVQQRPLERVFNVGTIMLDCRDDTTPVLKMKGIENPRHVADLIDEARRTERTRRGLYTINA